MSDPTAAARGAEDTARSALQDRRVERVARAGIASRAVNYTVLAILAANVVAGRGGTEVDRRGAVEAIAGAPFGRVVLVILCVGFLAYIAWQLLRAATRRPEQSALKDAGRRLLAAATAIVWAAFLVTAVRVLTGSSTSNPNASQESWTARLLANGAGRVLVLLVGAGVVAAGVGLVAYAARRKFESPLATWRMSAAVRRVATVLGVAGQCGRALVFVIVGGFLVSAALAKNAGQSKGLDASLRTLAGEPFGTAMLVLVALGFLAFGLYSFVDARYREDFSR